MDLLGESGESTYAMRAKGLMESSRVMPAGLSQAVWASRATAAEPALAVSLIGPPSSVSDSPPARGSPARAHLIGVLCFKRNASTARFVSGRRLEMPS